MRVDAQPPESSGPATALEALVRDAVQQVGARYSRPIGHVVERRRGQVFVVVEGAPPSPGTRLRASRPLKNSPGDQERLIAYLEVQRVSGGFIECKEVERTSRRHAEKGDRVRVQRKPPRVLLAPCIAQVDVPPVVHQVIGEWLRTAMLGRADLELAEDADLERAAEAAFWSGRVLEFLSELQATDEVLYPVLLQTPGKLLLNLEYFSVSRRRATHVDVAAVEHDEMTAAWLSAGKQRGPSPPGFRLLTTQVFPWRITALARSARGLLLAVTRDSIHVLDFRHPGLRPRTAVSLGPRRRLRREPYAWVLSGASLGDDTRDVSWVLSDERDPRAIFLLNDGVSPRVETSSSVQASEWFEGWWPSSWGPLPLTDSSGSDRGSPLALGPVVGDLDGDDRIDVGWTSSTGTLFIQRGDGSARMKLRGYGDVKTVQPSSGDGTRAVLWLSDPVCCGQPDRLHATQIVGEELGVAWSSPPLSGTVEAMVSCDLNRDGAFDLVVAERDDDGTKLYVFLALPGEQTTARGMELTAGSLR
jgi:hypothetical protein